MVRNSTIAWVCGTRRPHLRTRCAAASTIVVSRISAALVFGSSAAIGEKLSPSGLFVRGKPVYPLCPPYPDAAFGCRYRRRRCEREWATSSMMRVRPGIGIHGNEHRIVGNELTHLLMGTTDNGAIYAGRDWTARGTVIAGNFLHDIRADPGFENKGIYLDDEASGFVIRQNLFLRTDQPVFIGGGRDNIVERNLFVSSSPAIPRRFPRRDLGRQCDHRPSLGIARRLCRDAGRLAGMDAPLSGACDDPRRPAGRGETQQARRQCLRAEPALRFLGWRPDVLPRYRGKSRPGWDAPFVGRGPRRPWPPAPGIRPLSPISSMPPAGRSTSASALCFATKASRLLNGTPDRRLPDLATGGVRP